MEVTRHNFFELLDGVDRNLRNCCLVSFDAEFTAMPSNDGIRPRLFDDSAERYLRMRSSVCTSMMTQVGLTMFVYERDSGSYQAHTYTFHLRPQTVAHIDQTFRFQASTLEFLCRQSFDFNKFIYDGIVYLSRGEVKQLKSLQKSGELADALFRGLEMEHERELQDSCSKVSKWLNSSGEELSAEELHTLYLEPSTPVLRYMLHREIRTRFHHVLTTDSLGASDKVLIYRNSSAPGARQTPIAEVERRLMSELMGFSRVIELLAEYKKPMVGHNMYIDLILLHNQFLDPVPRSYAQYKRNIHSFAPELYDTKHIAAVMGRLLSFDDVWKSTGLMDLYEYFSQDKCEKLRRFGATVLPATPFRNNQTYHEAGFDSYCAGYLFLRLGAWAAFEVSGRGGAGASQTVAALRPHRNKVNLMRCAVPYMCTDGVDPPRHRPRLMHVQALRSKRIDVARVAALLSGYGTIDVQAYGPRAALVATSTHNTADKILAGFGSGEYRVTIYSPLRHSRVARIALWGGVALGGTAALVYLHGRVRS